MVCSRAVTLYVTGTPRCFRIKGKTQKENVTALLRSRKHPNFKKSVTGSCGEKISIHAYTSTEIIDANEIYVNYTYKRDNITLTYKIPGDCQTPGGYGSRRRYYICNFKSYNDLLNEEFCSRFFGFITGCYTSY
uniref:CUB domain-containing protein n=1 Tax=Strongyloides papillosus TaxID=174720 RepID=A0A0N5BGQ8_STREA